MQRDYLNLVSIYEANLDLAIIKVYLLISIKNYNLAKIDFVLNKNSDTHYNLQIDPRPQKKNVFLYIFS